jgi:hypothetical protein
VNPETAAIVLEEWERQRGDEFRAHFQSAYSYLSATVGELASDEAAWTITTNAGHSVLLLAGDRAFALLAFSGASNDVTMSGALHPLDEGVIRVSFNDQPAADDVDIGGAERFKPIVRQWVFDWHGRLQLPIEHWLPPLPTVRDDSPVSVALIHHERQRLVAHKLARGAGWPLSEVPGSSASAARPPP